MCGCRKVRTCKPIIIRKHKYGGNTSVMSSFLRTSRAFTAESRMGSATSRSCVSLHQTTSSERAYSLTVVLYRFHSSCDFLPLPLETVWFTKYTAVLAASMELSSAWAKATFWDAWWKYEENKECQDNLESHKQFSSFFSLDNQLGLQFDQLLSELCDLNNNNRVE